MHSSGRLGVQRGLHTAAAGVSTHDDMSNMKAPDGKLERRPTAPVCRLDEICDVTVDEDVARIQT